MYIRRSEREVKVPTVLSPLTLCAGPTALRDP